MFGLNEIGVNYCDLNGLALTAIEEGWDGSDCIEGIELHLSGLETH